MTSPTARRHIPAIDSGGEKQQRRNGRLCLLAVLTVNFFLARLLFSHVQDRIHLREEGFLRLRTPPWSRNATEPIANRVPPPPTSDRRHRTHHIPIDDEQWTYCRENNRVKSPPGTDRDPNRPYTITERTFRRHHDRVCSTPRELERAVRFGGRVWLNESAGSLPPLLREDHRSYFVPYGCDVPTPSAGEICSILNKYAHVVLAGDSMTRHARQGLFMALSRDFVTGGVLSNVKRGGNTPYTCRCDGQFSEDGSCRRNNNRYFYRMRPRDLELCPMLPEGEQFNLIGGERALEIPWNEADCRQPNYKGMLLYRQGNIKNDAKKTIEGIIEPLIKHERFQECQRLGKLAFLWGSYHAQSRALDKKYPTQSRDKTLVFNAAIQRYFQEAQVNVTIINHWNLTKDAQTADGFHFLSDVNLAKVYQIVHAADLLMP